MVLAALLAVALLTYRMLPDLRGVGSFVDTFAPWLGLGVPLLAAAALLRRTPLALIAVAVPALIWTVDFGGAWLPHGGGTPQVTVASLNLLATNTDPAGSVRELIAGSPDLVALQEVTPSARDDVLAALEGDYPHQVMISTVGLWSRYPITVTRPVDTGLQWQRALRAEVALPEGTVAVYVVHLGSMRPGETDLRDHTIAQLAEQVRDDDAPRLIVLGDFNTASTDRAFAPLEDLLTDAQSDAGRGLGFTWPAKFPLVRLDHVLYRGMDAVAAGTVRTRGSDHRAVTAAFS